VPFTSISLEIHTHLDWKSFPLPVCSTTLVNPLDLMSSRVFGSRMVSIKESKLVLPTVTNTVLLSDIANPLV